MSAESFFIEPETPESPRLRLKPDTSRSMLVLLFSLVFLYVGFKIVEAGEPGGWLLLGLFGFAIIASLSVVLPGASFLEIDARGITVASSFRQKTYRWDQIERIGIFELGFIRRVGIDFNSRYQGPERVPDFAKPAFGYHTCLPVMSGMTLEDLLEVMQECRNRVHTTPAVSSPPGEQKIVVR